MDWYVPARRVVAAAPAAAVRAMPLEDARHE
jgi:hypothetical protein